MPETVESTAPGAHPVAQAGANPGASGGRRRGLRNLVRVAVVIALIIAAALIPWAGLAQALRDADLLWIAVAAGLSLSIYPFWVWQWRLLVQPVTPIRWETTAEVVMCSAAAKSAAATVGGLASAAAMLNLRAGVPLAATAGILAIDQLLVGVAKLAVLILAMWLAALPWPVLAGTLSLAGGMAALLAVLLLVQTGTVRAALPAAIGRRLAALVDGLRLMDNPARLILATALALVKKATEVATALAIQYAVGIEPSLAAAILTVAAVSLATLVPVLPGNMGTHAAGVYIVYEALGVGTALALSAALLQHATVFLGQVCAGLGAVVLGRRAEARVSRAESAA